MDAAKVMLFADGVDQGIRCRLISDWYKVDFYLPDSSEHSGQAGIYSTEEGLLWAIRKYNPNIVFIDLNLYARIDGIKTAQIIRYQYGVPVLYVW